MSTDYRKVAEALQSGVDPAMLCMTCPWDRFCITPPSMSTSDVEAAMKKAAAEDDKRESRGESKSGLPVSMLLTALTTATKDLEALVCPVFAIRLRSDGRDIVDELKNQMKGWKAL